MNTAAIKKYAPRARRDFIDAVTRQAIKLGITPKGIAPMEIKGDLALINEQPFPAAIANARTSLARLVEHNGFQQTMEQAAYSWFNRLCAIRYMEVNGLLDHGSRILSHPAIEGHFQILDDCLDIDLASLSPSLD